MSDATVAAEYGCTIYELRRHRKGGPNSKRSTWCVTCLQQRGQAACTAEERCTPEMRAAMAELLSLVT